VSGKNDTYIKGILMTNLIEFPLKPVKPMNEQDVNDAIENLHRYHVDESIEVLSYKLFEMLVILGFKCPEEDDEEGQKLASFMLESIKSFCLSKYGIEHPFQQVANTMLDSIEGEYFITDTLMVKLDDVKKDDGEVTL
jgi:hypothetical protein